MGPGSSRSVLHRGQMPFTRIAVVKQMPQMPPSGQ
jgi:hypothetical protein